MLEAAATVGSEEVRDIDADAYAKAIHFLEACFEWASCWLRTLRPRVLKKEEPDTFSQRICATAEGACL